MFLLAGRHDKAAPGRGTGTDRGLLASEHVDGIEALNGTSPSRSTSTSFAADLRMSPPRGHHSEARLSPTAAAEDAAALGTGLCNIDCGTKRSVEKYLILA